MMEGISWLGKMKELHLTPPACLFPPQLYFYIFYIGNRSTFSISCNYFLDYPLQYSAMQFQFFPSLLCFYIFSLIFSTIQKYNALCSLAVLCFVKNTLTKNCEIVQLVALNFDEILHCDVLHKILSNTEVQCIAQNTRTRCRTNRDCGKERPSVDERKRMNGFFLILG